MNQPNAAKQDLIPAERLAEAGVWIARLHGAERSRELETAVRQWLQENPLNARAFELATEVWEDAGNLRRVVPLAATFRPRRRSRHLSTAAAVVAVAALVIVASVLYSHSDGVATAVGEQRMLTLSDGTRIYLNTATRIVPRYDRNARRVELRGGEALFDVAKKPHWPFIVTAGDRQVRALGTSFVVRWDAERLAVTLVQGKVTVSPASPGESDRTAASAAPMQLKAGTFTLTPGQRLTFSPDGSARLDSPSIEKTIAWRQGQVVLDDTPLASAVAEMNRYNSVKLAIERPEAQGLLISGLFQAGDSGSFARAVAQMHGLTVIDQGDRIILSGTPGSARR